MDVRQGRPPPPVPFRRRANTTCSPEQTTDTLTTEDHTSSIYRPNRALTKRTQTVTLRTKSKKPTLTPELRESQVNRLKEWRARLREEMGTEKEVKNEPTNPDCTLNPQDNNNTSNTVTSPTIPARTHEVPRPTRSTPVLPSQRDFGSRTLPRNPRNPSPRELPKTNPNLNTPSATIPSPRELPQPNSITKINSPTSRIPSPREIPQPNTNTRINSPAARIPSPRELPQPSSNQNLNTASRISSPRDLPQPNSNTTSRTSSPRDVPQPNSNTTSRISSPRDLPQPGTNIKLNSPTSRIPSPRELPAQSNNLKSPIVPRDASTNNTTNTSKPPIPASREANGRPRPISIATPSQNRPDSIASPAQNNTVRPISMASPAQSNTMRPISVASPAQSHTMRPISVASPALNRNNECRSPPLSPPRRQLNGFASLPKPSVSDKTETQPKLAGSTSLNSAPNRPPPVLRQTNPAVSTQPDISSVDRLKLMKSDPTNNKSSADVEKKPSEETTSKKDKKKTKKKKKKGSSDPKEKKKKKGSDSTEKEPKPKNPSFIKSPFRTLRRLSIARDTREDEEVPSTLASSLSPRGGSLVRPPLQSKILCTSPNYTVRSHNSPVAQRSRDEDVKYNTVRADFKPLPKVPARSRPPLPTNPQGMSVSDRFTIPSRPSVNLRDLKT